MNGTTLSGRYELIERIGGGGMALVYKAKDRLLHRHVAVKVLRQQYVHDEEFIRRFRREAQSAASLSHPNIVSVYDVGQDEDCHFIVMEYIEGSNLNDIIKATAPMQAEEAVRIATQICDALEHAHANGIIHRDIKPHNILIGKNGRVKVTDFGIARAITSSTITQTGSVIGSVHYFSPEHAKGVSAGEKSDLYSLGIVVYQMLTAKLPFIGESPISVALKHLQEQVEEPRTVNPMIPQSVENIILKSLRKRPEERYATAGEMLRDLETCLSPERRDEPKWTYASDSEVDEEATRVIPAIRADARPSGGVAAEGDTELYNGPPVWRDEDGEEEEKSTNPWIKPLVWFFVILVLLGAAWWGVKKVQALFVIPTVEVPNVEGAKLERAIADIEGAGLVVEEPVYEFSRDVPADYVISQTKAGDKVRPQTKIRLYVSKGVELKELPDLVKKPEQEARAMLLEMGFPEGSIQIDRDHSDESAGNVIQQFPSAGQQVDPVEDQIRLIVSEGREEIEMPSVIGLLPQEAQALLEREGLKLLDKNIIPSKEYFEKGKVFKQFPYQPGDPVKPPGENIMIYVSEGLPDEARVTVYTVSIGPKTPGEESQIRILLSDSMGDRVEVANRKVASEQSFTFDVVTSPNKNAVIEVYQDDHKVEQYTWTYNEASQGTGSSAISSEETLAEPDLAESEQADGEQE